MADGWDDEFYYAQQVECACGSPWFVYYAPEGFFPVFGIDETGQPVEALGHPVCADCGMDWPIVIESGEDEVHVFTSCDLELGVRDGNSTDTEEQEVEETEE